MKANMLTTLGEARAYAWIYSNANPIRQATADRYMEEYAFYLKGKLPDRAASAAGRRCAEVGVRYGALRGILSALPALEAAVADGDEAAAEGPEAEIRASLDTFRRFPPRPFGQPPGPRKTSAARTVEIVYVGCDAQVRGIAGAGGGDPAHAADSSPGGKGSSPCE